MREILNKCLNTSLFSHMQVTLCLLIWSHQEEYAVL